MSEPRYPEEKEYETLRAELLDGKKYVFERPILIITAALASVQLLEKGQAIYLTPIVIWLLSFNLWFTVNRIGSIARIVAYIQLILEDKDALWFGWETSLRKYRKWLKNGNLNVRTIQINQEAVYDSLGYYPVIFYVHVAANFLTAGLSVAYALATPSVLAWLIVGIVLLSVGVFTLYASKNSPRMIRPQIEQNRKIWGDVLANWEAL
ncbi:MAG: hypothetical protein V2B19_17460 [Pseudomonadota bacterium]